MVRTQTLAVLAAAAALMALPAAAQAAVTAKVSIITKSGASRVAVKLASTKAVSLRARPKTVKLSYGRKAYTLTRVRGSAAAVSLGTWVAIGYLAIVSSCWAYLWWNDGIRTIGAGRAAVFTFIVPLAAMLSAIPILGEWPGPVQLAGGALILGGLFQGWSWAALQPWEESIRVSQPFWVTRLFAGAAITGGQIAFAYNFYKTWQLSRAQAFQSSAA